MKWRDAWENCTMVSYIDCTLHRILSKKWNQGGKDRLDTQHSLGIINAYSTYCGMAEGIILKLIKRKYISEVEDGLD